MRRSWHVDLPVAGCEQDEPLPALRDPIISAVDDLPGDGVSTAVQVAKEAIPGRPPWNLVQPWDVLDDECIWLQAVHEGDKRQ